MSHIAYDWKVLSVDANARTFVVEYSADGKTPMVYNLAVPNNLDQLADVVHANAPAYDWRQTTLAATVTQDPIDVDAILQMSGASVIQPIVEKTAQEIESLMSEDFKARVSSALFALGVTATDIFAEQLAAKQSMTTEPVHDETTTSTNS